MAGNGHPPYDEFRYFKISSMLMGYWYHNIIYIVTIHKIFPT